MPTENRSSNTDMVNVPRELTREMLNGVCMHPDLARSLWSALLKNAPQPVQQNHAEPVAWQVKWPDGSRELYAHELGAKASLQPYEPLYPHADPGEVEALRGAYLRAGEREHELRKELAALRQHKIDYMEAAEETRKALLAQLAERNALLLDIKRSYGVMLMTHPPQDPWINNRIDERINEALADKS